MPPAIASRQVHDWTSLFPGMDASRRAFALAEAAAGRFSFWDALFLATAADGGCVIALSEDMADGVRLGEIAVRSPFDPEGGMSAAARGLLEAA